MQLNFQVGGNTEPSDVAWVEWKQGQQIKADKTPVRTRDQRCLLWGKEKHKG